MTKKVKKVKPESPVEDLHGLCSGKKIVVFDLETTGKVPDIDRIVQFAAVKLGEDLSENGMMSIMINPDHPISPEASAVHGFKNEDLVECPKFSEVADSIFDFLVDCDLCGHNLIAFDLPILIAEFARIGKVFSFSDRRLLDTLETFRHFVPHTLEGALLHYCGEVLENAHNALYDARAAAKILKAQVTKHDLGVDKMYEVSRGARVTLDGKLIRREDGEIVLSFGKYKGVALRGLVQSDPGFLRWVLRMDFSAETKGYVLRALQGQL